MSFETIRINEIAKELGMTSKEIIEKLAQMSITGKTHSSTITMEQYNRLKDFIKSGGVKEVKKPKAFVVKKAKAPEVQEIHEKKEEATAKVEEKKATVITGLIMILVGILSAFSASAESNRPDSSSTVTSSPGFASISRISSVH